MIIYRRQNNILIPENLIRISADIRVGIFCTYRTFSAVSTNRAGNISAKSTQFSIPIFNKCMQKDFGTKTKIYTIYCQMEKSILRDYL